MRGSWRESKEVDAPWDVCGINYGQGSWPPSMLERSSTVGAAWARPSQHILPRHGVPNTALAAASVADPARLRQ